ncbi:hypothetical protein PTTG_08897 [Puccinia triticina 1-1 BBBD Race 1]|uniref:Uncharacterized protein n=1 Tax=Puccinia triticina (isolate 1-1 / race 1 (BBBD)) TaxID=630390 RepID=A0A180H2G4_PUCT1|nr:hypothetical protein PTTG_08897 [Puccinia triticina 1-1 BBBD Race 1]
MQSLAVQQPSSQEDSCSGSTSLSSFQLDFDNLLLARPLDSSNTSQGDLHLRPKDTPIDLLGLPTNTASTNDNNMESLSDPDVLAPTAPDLTFSFVQSTNWRPATPVPKSNNNVQSKSPSGLALESTPTKDFKHKLPGSFNRQEEEDDDEEEDDHGKEAHGCFSSPTPISSPLKARAQTVKMDQRATKSNSRPVSHMGFSSPGSGMVMAAASEKVKPKKSLGFILGGSGRIRSSTCLESQLEDVLSQQSSPALADPQHHGGPTTVYRLPHAFLSFLPTDQQPLGPSASTDDQRITNQSDSKPSKDPSNRRPSFNLLDRATLSFSNTSFRTINSSNTDPCPYVASPTTSSKSPAKHQPSPNGKSPYIRSSRSFLNLLSSKLK